MKFVRWISRVTPFSKTVALLLYFIVAAVFFSVGQRHGEKTRQHEVSKLLVETREELRYCTNDLAKLIRSYETGPSSTLGVHSPFFAGKSVSVREWKYKTDTIRQYTIELKDQSPPVKVQIWDFDGVKHYAVFDDKGKATNLPIVGYEAWGKYTDAAVDRLWWRFPGELATVKLIRSGHSIYVQVIGVKPKNSSDSEKAALIKALRPLEKIVDTFTF